MSKKCFDKNLTEKKFAISLLSIITATVALSVTASSMFSGKDVQTTVCADENPQIITSESSNGNRNDYLENNGIEMIQNGFQSAISTPLIIKYGKEINKAAENAIINTQMAAAIQSSFEIGNINFDTDYNDNEDDAPADDSVNSICYPMGDSHLTAYGGVFYGPSGKETYYNLSMDGVVSIMRNSGYDENTYPYWIRSDGCKMLGNYIMLACNLDVRPRGSLVETSLGTGIVCDKCPSSVGENIYQIDIATAW